MRSRTSVAFGLALALSSAAIGSALAQTDDWMRFYDSGGGYSITMPRPPAQVSGKIKFGLFKTQTHHGMIANLGRAGSLEVTVSDLAETGATAAALARPGAQDQLFEQQIAHALQLQKAVLISKSALIFKGYPARDITWKRTDGQLVGQSRFVLVGARLFFMGAVSGTTIGIPAQYLHMARSIDFNFR